MADRLCRCVEVVPASLRLRIIDAALFPGATPAEGHVPDYRLEIDTPTGGEVSFHRGADAADVVAYVRHERWLPEQHSMATGSNPSTGGPS